MQLKTCFLSIRCIVKIFYKDIVLFKLLSLQETNSHTAALRKTGFVIKTYKKPQWKSHRKQIMGTTTVLSPESGAGGWPAGQFCSRDLMKKSTGRYPPKAPKPAIYIAQLCPRDLSTLTISQDHSFFVYILNKFLSF